MRALILIAMLSLAGCGGVTPGAPCKSDGDCTEGFKCGPLDSCEEPRMIDGCRMTAKCQEFGYCLANEGHCRASEASCKASLYCQMKGYCSVQKGGLGCMVGSDADCKHSDACQLGNKCRMHDGRCVLGQPDPEPVAEDEAIADEPASGEGVAK